MVSGFRDTTTQITHSMTVVFQTWMCYILALNSLRVYSPQLAAFFGIHLSIFNLFKRFQYGFNPCSLSPLWS